jgi:hypothetical protein
MVEAKGTGLVHMSGAHPEEIGHFEQLARKSIEQ